MTPPRRGAAGGRDRSVTPPRRRIARSSTPPRVRKEEEGRERMVKKEEKNE